MSEVKSVVRALSILSAIGESPTSLSELARRVALPVSTTSRLLATLEAGGAVERIDDGAVYRIGPVVVSMAAGSDGASAVAAVARPEMEELALEVGEVVGLGVAAGFSVQYVSQVDTAHSVQVEDWVGRAVPMHLVSSGYALLSCWSDSVVERFLAGPLIATTPDSVTDPDRIRERIEEVRLTGVSWTAEEFVEGITSVAVPLLDASGEGVAAIHISGPTYRFAEGQPRVEAALKRAAGLITVSL